MAILPHGDQNIPLGGADPSTDAGAAHQTGPEVCREREVGPKHGGRGGTVTLSVRTLSPSCLWVRGGGCPSVSLLISENEDYGSTISVKIQLCCDDLLAILPNQYR